ncbi:MAG: adenylate/guanylate cyclase domain-containing protein [Pseudomonadota bacterium]
MPLVADKALIETKAGALADDAEWLRYSPVSLRFEKEGVEEAYLDFRKPTILQTLRLILMIGPTLVFVGSIIDISQPNYSDVENLTIIRIIVCFGMLGALLMTYVPQVQDRLTEFIFAGSAATHLVWLTAAFAIGERITDYVGVLPINLMLTFLVSGLFFRHAVWIALASAAAYAVTLYLLIPGWLPPTLFMLIAAVYAGIAAYLAEKARRDAWLERQRSESLLLNVLPKSIASRMRDGEQLIADRFNDAAVLFADIAGFTKMSARMEPETLVEILDDIFRRFDNIVEEEDLEKIKTIGDCYMMACGLPAERPKDAHRIARAALRMREELAKVAEKHNEELTIRIGIHAGPVVAGVIGRSKFIYDLWGDTVNTASRMESTAPLGYIQISQAMADRLGEAFVCADGGEVEMKGKGLQQVYHLKGAA